MAWWPLSPGLRHVFTVSLMTLSVPDVHELRMSQQWTALWMSLPEEMPHGAQPELLDCDPLPTQLLELPHGVVTNIKRRIFQKTVPDVKILIALHVYHICWCPTL